MGRIRIVLYGVGAVGGLIAKYLLTKDGAEIVGAIDVAEEKVGEDLGRVLNIGKSVGVIISNDVDDVLSKTRPNIVVHATASYLVDVFPQLAQILKHKVNVVSTCEELSYPYFSKPQLAEKLDILDKMHKSTIIGTGINPGFLMDTLVITLTAVCQKIRKIKAVRIMNAATRRTPFQKKIGAGLSLEKFQKAIENGFITGHVGLEQSVSMIAAALAWKLESVRTSPVQPLIADKPVRSEAIDVKQGHVAGLKQEAKGYRNGKEAIALEFQAYIGASEEYDSITIKGVPNVNQKIMPCVHGDISTVAVVVNTIPKIINAPPGLVTMKDLPVPSATTVNMVNFLL
ncbi:MAG: dihydrodipicolinate reductase [Candidatus Bathyarchaeota archaeon]|nr:MAG: dihydrodipicolinate reductase [Candidatus Bathyarchaeota archaeon]